MKQVWLTGEVFQDIYPIPEAVCQLGLKPGELLVYIYLLYRKNQRSGQCRPSYATIGKAVGMSRKAVQNHVHGLIRTENTTVRWGGHSYNGNLLYTLKPMELVLKERDRVLLEELALAGLRCKAEQEAAAAHRPPVCPEKSSSHKTVDASLQRRTQGTHRHPREPLCEAPTAGPGTSPPKA